jgi:hypothetical protein
VTTDPDLISLAMQMVQQQSAAAPEASTAEETPEPATGGATPPPLPPAPVNIGLLPPSPVRETKSADELAAMILADLQKVNGCPAAGITVTVYGSNPWNCWLHFGGAAGPLHTKAELQKFCDIFTDRLRRLYDVAV